MPPHRMVSGKIRVISLNSYAPFEPGSWQYNWVVAQFKAFNRAVTPWLIVLQHAPTYHTYVNHYKDSGERCCCQHFALSQS